MARLDPLTAALLRADAGDWTPDTRRALQFEAGRFLRAGGRLSMADWAAASEDVRDAFVAAGDALWRPSAATRRSDGPDPVIDEHGAAQALRHAVDHVARSVVA